MSASTVPNERDFTIPKTQKIATFETHGGPTKIVEAPVVQQNELKQGEVLVKIIYSGVCHTDVHVNLGDWPLDSILPCTGGHEGAGYIVGIGEGSSSSLKIGDRVGIKWIASSCLSCELCQKGLESSCEHAKCSGFSVHGTFQQYAVSYADHVSPIPDDLELSMAAPILCAGVTVWKAIKTSGLTAGETIVISGAGGGLGHLAVQYATAIGLRVIALDTGADKRALCAKLGAESFIDFAQSKDLVGDIKKATGGKGPHAAIVAAAGAKAYEQALDYIRSGGTLVAVGLPADAHIKANVFFTVFRSLSIRGSYVGNRADAIQALDFAARGKVKTTYTIKPFAELPNVFADMQKGNVTGRVVLNLWE